MTIHMLLKLQLQPLLRAQAASVFALRFHHAYSALEQDPSPRTPVNSTMWMEHSQNAEPTRVKSSSALVTSIPHIIHQSWRTKRLESFQKQWQKTWLDNHPDWTYMFWTDKDNRRLVAEHYPWFLEVYDQLPRSIQRADCARYFYMLHFGGCYFDLDFESLKNLDPLMHNLHAAVSYMTADTGSEISIPNAFLASVPGHAFWYFVIQHVTLAFTGGEVDQGDVHRVTGPIMLKQALASYQLNSPTKDLTIFPAETVIGVDFNWRDDPKMQKVFSVCHAPSKTFNSSRCKEFFPDSYAVTYWSGDITWMVGNH